MMITSYERPLRASPLGGKSLCLQILKKTGENLLNFYSSADLLSFSVVGFILAGMVTKIPVSDPGEGVGGVRPPPYIFGRVMIF